MRPTAAATYTAMQIIRGSQPRAGLGAGTAPSKRAGWGTSSRRAVVVMPGGTARPTPPYCGVAATRRGLITDGNERVALAVARSLVRAGHAVWVAAPTRVSLAGVSRAVRPCLLAPDPLTDPARYATEVARIASEQGAQILLPLTDASVEAVLEHAAALPPGVALPFPDPATYRAASDKAQVLRLAERCGYAVPETRFIATWGERDGVPPDAGFFPAVIKPHRSVVSVAGGRRKLLVTPVADAAACHRALDALPAAAFPVL